MPLAPEILLVTDDTTLGSELSEALDTHGYYIAAHAESGELALAMLRILRFDLVLIDVRLPGSISGVETGAHIRARSMVPILYVTEAADAALALAAKTQPCGFVLTPFQPRQLKAAVEAAVRLGGYTGREIVDTLIPPGTPIDATRAFETEAAVPAL